MRISDWSSDVCSSDLPGLISNRRARKHPSDLLTPVRVAQSQHAGPRDSTVACFGDQHMRATPRSNLRAVRHDQKLVLLGQSGQPIPNGGRHRSAHATVDFIEDHRIRPANTRSEENTSELQSLMRISYAVFCLKKKTKTKT